MAGGPELERESYEREGDMHEEKVDSGGRLECNGGRVSVEDP
jgi:hypothetical protein